MVEVRKALEVSLVMALILVSLSAFDSRLVSSAPSVVLSDKEIAPYPDRISSIKFTVTVDSPASIRLWFQVKANLTESGERLSEYVGSFEIVDARRFTLAFVDPYDPRFERLPAIRGDTVYIVDPYSYYDWPADWVYGITTAVDSWENALTGYMKEIAPHGDIDDAAIVYDVIDGDTFDSFPTGRVRLADIDAPESGEDGYSEAKDFLNSLIAGKRVYLDVDGIYVMDPYERLVCLVYVRHNSTHLQNVNKALVESGHATEQDYPNEFNPQSWTLYVRHLQTDLPEETYKELLSAHLELRSNYENLTSTIHNLKDAYAALGAEYGDLLLDYSTLEAALGSVRLHYETLDFVLNQTREAYEASNADYGRLKSDYDNIKTDYDSLQSNYDELCSAYSDLELRHDDMKAAFDNLAASQGQLMNEYASINESYNLLETTFDDLSAEMGVYKLLLYTLAATTIVLAALTIFQRRRVSAR